MRHGRALDGGGRGEAPLGGPRGPRRGKRRGARYPKGFKFSSAAAARADRVHVAPRARARGQDMPHELYPLTVPRDTIPRRAPQRFRAAAMNIRKHGFFFLVVVGGLGVLVGVGGGGDGAATSDSFTHRGAWAVTVHLLVLSSFCVANWPRATNFGGCTKFSCFIRNGKLHQAGW